MRLKQGLRFPGIEHIKSKILVYPFDSKLNLKYLRFVCVCVCVCVCVSGEGSSENPNVVKKECEVSLPPFTLTTTVLA